MAKILGWILMLLGLAFIIGNIFFSQYTSKVPVLSQKPLIAGIVGAVLIVLGFLFSKTKKQAGEEVPIYHGKKIIGYRRK
ncbi:MAG: hypothetical protein AABX71_02225 [Nanoarchaeota archaeon]